MQTLLDDPDCQLCAASMPFRGHKVIAEYRDPGLDAYRGNPLIEALPAPLSEQEAAGALANRISYREEVIFPAF